MVKLNKETTMKKILKQCKVLHNDHQVPFILGIYSKNGILSFGSRNLVAKFKGELKNESEDDPESWITAVQTDQDAILTGERLSEEMDSYSQAQGEVLPERFPAPLDLMVFNEIHPIVSREILKWYWRQGGTYKVIRFGDPAFKADFWPESWPWESLTKTFAHMKKNDYAGPQQSNMTEFLRQVLKEICRFYSINPNTYVSKAFTETKRKNRERRRGIHREPDVAIINENVGTGSNDVENDEQDIQYYHDSFGFMTPAVVMNNTEENDCSNEQDDSQHDELENDRDNGQINEHENDLEEAHDNENFNGNYVGQNDEDGSDTPNVNNSILDEESCIFSTEELDAIEEVIGSADVLADEISTNDIVSPASNDLSISRKRRFQNDNETIQSNHPLTVLRKGPSQLNNPRIPSKEPRIHLQVSNTAPSVRNVGNCSTPLRTARIPRNNSQNAAPGSADALEDLRKIKMISDIVEAFKDISEANTMAIPKKETGGLLFGREVDDGYIIDTLLIPKQNGYSTYFETTDEYGIHNFCNSDPDLVLLGIIHTHPGFDAFLSSIDLHMLHRYTLENPSVISIVLAPEQNHFPIFSLTKTGVMCLNQCQRDVRRAHRHDRSGLFRLAKHVTYVNTGHIRVEDQR